MENINNLRNEVSRVAAEICVCNDADERKRLVKKVDDIAGQIPPDDAMIFYQWRHYDGTA